MYEPGLPKKRTAVRSGSLSNIFCCEHEQRAPSAADFKIIIGFAATAATQIPFTTAPNMARSGIDNGISFLLFRRNYATSKGEVKIKTIIDLKKLFAN
jgi:hypothetical protein